MKRARFGWLILLLAALALPLARAAEPFQAGRHYLELPRPQPVETGEKIELREFFWYGCPHCYSLEPALNAYVKKLPSHVRFVRTPGVAPHWLIHAQAFYTFEVLGVTEKLHAPFFEAWHAKNRPLNNEASIAEFAAERGVDKAKFKEAFNSFAVRTRLERARQLNAGFMVDGVPALAVDGRYLTSPAAAGGEEAVFKVADFLIRKAVTERKKSPAR